MITDLWNMNLLKYYRYLPICIILKIQLHDLNITLNTT